MLEGKNCDGETKGTAREMGRQGMQLILIWAGSPHYKVTGENKSYGYLEEKYSGPRNSKCFLKQKCLLACLKNYKDTQGLLT